MGYLPAVQDGTVSEDILRIIATVPDWMPTEASAAMARLAVGGFCPNADEVAVERYDQVRFIDQGGNFELVRCPACRAELELSWWHDQMERAYQRQFADLAITTPCCAAVSTLNDLDYHWPAGFARFELTARNPGRGWLTAEMNELANALDHPVRQIFSHY